MMYIYDVYMYNDDETYNDVYMKGLLSLIQYLK